MTAHTIIVHHPIPDQLRHHLQQAGYTPIATSQRTTTFGTLESPSHSQAGHTPTTSQAGTEQFISLPEWCRRVGCSLDAGYRAARRNDIPGLFRIGKLMRINWNAFVTSTEMVAGNA